MKAYGFDVQEIEGQDMRQFLDAFDVAKRRDNGKPQFIIAHTLIGKGIPEVAGTYKAHGEAGAKFVDAARKALGLPDEHYFVSNDVYDYFAQHKKTLLAEYDRWEKTYDAWRAKNPTNAKLLDDGLAREVPPDLLSKIPEFPKDAKLATRKAGGEVVAADRAGDAVAHERQRRSVRIDNELHQGRVAISLATISAAVTSVSAFESTACVRSSTASRITDCFARRARHSRCLPIIAVVPFG
jgi:hypothetical protein